MKNIYVMTVLILSISMGMRGADLPQSLTWSPMTRARYCAYRESSDASPSPRLLQSSSFRSTQFACQEGWGQPLCEAYNKRKDDLNKRYVSEKTWESPCSHSHRLFDKLLDRLEKLALEKRERVANALAAELATSEIETPRLLSTWLNVKKNLESFSPLQITRVLKEERKVSAAGVSVDLFALPKAAPRVAVAMPAAMSVD